MSKIYQKSEKKEMEEFLSSSEQISPKLRNILLEDLHHKGTHYKDGIVWLISRNEAITIDVFDIKGDIFESDTYFYKDFS